MFYFHCLVTFMNWDALTQLDSAVEGVATRFQ